jgi:hypothetical protein
MRFNEFNDGLQRFTATVRVVGKTSSITARTAIYAESPTHGRAMLERMYGVGNVLSISQAIAEQGSKILSPDEQRVKAIADQAKRLNQQAKQMRAQNALKKAQSAMPATGTR